MNIDDIYYEMEINLIDKNYNELNLQEKKDLIFSELKKYLVDKFYLNQSYLDEDIKEVIDKINTLFLDTDEKNKIFTKITFLILGLIEVLQSYSITWFIEKNTQDPILTIDSEKRFDNLVTSEDMDTMNITLFVIEEFQNSEDLNKSARDIKEKRKF